MKSLRLLVFVLVSAGFVFAAAAQTADNLPRGNVSGFASFAASVSDGLDRGNGFGGSASFFFSRLLGVEGGWRRQSFDLIGNDTNSLSGGELDADVITANLVTRIASGRVQPYVSGGLAFFVNNYAIDSTLLADLEAFGFTAAESIDNAVGFNVGAGVDIQASARIGVFVEGRFFAATADTLASLTDNVTQITGDAPGEQEMNVFAVTGGVRIFFF